MADVKNDDKRNSRSTLRFLTPTGTHNSAINYVRIISGASNDT